MPKKKIFNSSVASLILCPSFVCKLQHECEDITKNAWRPPLNAQCNIEYRFQYSLFFTSLNFTFRNRLFLYFLVNYRISLTLTTTSRFFCKKTRFLFFFLFFVFFCNTRVFNRYILIKYCYCQHLGLSKMLKNTLWREYFGRTLFEIVSQC